MKPTILLLLAVFILNRSNAQNQLQENENASIRFEKADKELNKVYNELLPLLKDRNRELLVKAQRSWIAFRDDHCKYAKSFYQGGTIQPQVYSDCLTELTNQRIKQLRDDLAEKRKQ